MFEEIITTLAQKWGLGTHARAFLQMLLAKISDPAHGGFSGFIQRLRDGGLAQSLDGWITSPNAAMAASPLDLERAVGDKNLISDMASRFGIDRSKITAALGFAIPAIVSRVAQGGVLPSSLSAEAESFIGNRSAWSAVPPTVPRAADVHVPAKSKSWLPWIVLAILALLALGYCTTKKTAEPVVTTPAPVALAPVVETPAPAPAVVPEMTVAEPEGAAVVAAMDNGRPTLKVYFDVAKTTVADEFKEKSSALVEHMKANPDVKAVISGFNDPTGDAAANAKLAKGRAEAVQQHLVAEGIAKDRTLLEKPAETTGTAVTNAASRRVDVMLR